VVYYIKGVFESRKRLHVTQHGPTLGNEYGKPLPFLYTYWRTADVFGRCLYNC